MYRVAKLAAVLILGMAVSACSTQNVSGADQTSPRQVLAQADPDRIVCKSVKKTGTRIGTRECRTYRNWENLRRRGRAWTDDMQRKATHSSGDLRPGAGGGP